MDEEKEGWNISALGSGTLPAPSAWGSYSQAFLGRCLPWEHQLLLFTFLLSTG